MEIDTAPQTYEVVRYTEPHRVLSKLTDSEAKQTTPTTTHLDIVLTGVGEKPTAGDADPGVGEAAGSIFFNLANSFGIDMAAMVGQERIVGDLAFTAIRPDGETVPLRKRIEGKSGDATTECMFYSAVQLPIFEAMANDPAKAVILVARGDKVPAVYASICGAHRYASSLVVDEETARKLLRY